MANNEQKNNKFDYLEKRFSDFKTYATASAAFGTLIFAAIVILFGFNYKAQLDDLRQLKIKTENEIKEFLGKGEKKPDLILNDYNGNPIENATLQAYLDTTKYYKKEQFLSLQFVIKNIGNTHSNNIWIRYYSNAPIYYEMRTHEITNFKYYHLKKPEQHSIGILPGGGYLTSYGMTWMIEGRKLIKNESIHPMMIKLYYGDGLTKEINFSIKITYDKQYKPVIVN